MAEVEKRKIRVFIASPGDLVEERRLFNKAIEQLNVGFGDGANVEYIPLGWEDTLAITGRRSQGVINQDIDTCDVFILTLFRRWGQESPDAQPYSSYTEEEFHRALERWENSGVPEIFVFFKRVDAASEADPGPQLEKVIKFRKQLEDTRKVLYRPFDTPESFMDEVDRHLRAYAKGELSKVEKEDCGVMLPLNLLEEVDKAKKVALQKCEEAKNANDVAEEARLRIESMQLEMAEDAAKLAKEGKVEYAREKLTKLVTETTDLQILFLGFDFFNRTGDLNSAVIVLEKWLNLSSIENKPDDTATALGNLANIYHTWGELERAEEMYYKSLTIYEALGNKEGMATAYGNLGNVFLEWGELERAEEMYHKSLVINKSLGCKEGMARDYGNLGVVYLSQGEYGQAEEKCQMAVDIYGAIGATEGLANQYGNLGKIYQERGELERAKKMHKKALAIDESLGRKEGMANQYGNLGNVYYRFEDFEQAEEMYQKALAIDELLGRKRGIAFAYANLGNVYYSREDFDRAEELYQKALAINELLCSKESMAIDYGNLGNLYNARDDQERAVAMYEKALILFREIQSPNAEVVEESLRDLRGEGS